MNSSLTDRPKTTAPEAPKTRPLWFYKALVVLATVFWGGSFVVLKDAVDAVPPGWLMGMRFCAATLILAVVFRRTLRAHMDVDHLKAGMVLGFFSFMGFWVQNIGLTDTTPGHNAFLTATYCVMVPFIYWAVARKRPHWYNIVAALVCIVGVGFVSLGGDFSLTLRWGDGITLIGAVFFAFHIVFVAKLAPGRDIMTLTIVQIGSSGVFSLIAGLLTEPMPSADAFTFDFWMQFGYIVIFASCLAMVFQNIAQAHVPPAQCALLLSLESVFGITFSVMFGYESLTVALVIGFALIFAAILMSELLPMRQVEKDLTRERYAAEGVGEGNGDGAETADASSGGGEGVKTGSGIDGDTVDAGDSTSHP
jgi:drug/metabolite transporter (DMT)-like permease